MTTPTKIRVIIADDHPVFRNGIVTALRAVPFIQKVSQASNGQELLSCLEHEFHEVVLMDIRMTPIDGLQATEIIRQTYPDVKVIALSSYEDASFVLSMMQKGATGYLLKNADKNVIIAAIESVMNGQHYYSKEVERLMHDSVDRIVSHATDDNALKYANPLYREIIFLVCNEYTNKEIGKILNKSKRTIDAYRSEILKLTKTTNSHGLHSYALKSGILEDAYLKVKFEQLLRA
jgi:DNA-binding NarL/FixJ family response regulator